MGWGFQKYSHADVVKVKDWCIAQFDAVVTRFVCREDTESLTRKGFLNKVDRLLEQKGNVFILYNAGHGTKDAPFPGAFCLKGKRENNYVQLSDFINAWAEPCE